MRNSFVTNDFMAKARDLLRLTQTKVVIGALICGGTFSSISYKNEALKESRIPTAFSEVHSTTRRLAAEGKQLPPLTAYYTKTNDFLMQVFEANNTAVEISREHRVFGKELEFRIEPMERIHEQIPEYVKELRSVTHAALQSTHKLVEAEQELPAVSKSLFGCWDVSHDDVTRLEPTISTDSKGKTSVSYSSVYDHTTHTYEYHPKEGHKAARLLQDFIQNHPDLNTEERLIPATVTGADNEYAIERSMRDLFDGKIPTKEQALKLANTCLTTPWFLRD